MWKNVGIIRNQAGLEEAKRSVQDMLKEFDYSFKCPDRLHYEVRNMLMLSQLIIDFALARKESRGAHYREDFPLKDSIAKSHELSLTTVMKG